MTRKWKRDKYGNVISEESSNDDQKPDPAGGTGKGQAQSGTALDWRDYIAITIASLQTFLLPIVILIILLVGIVLGLAFFK